MVTKANFGRLTCPEAFWRRTKLNQFVPIFVPKLNTTDDIFVILKMNLKPQ